MLGEVFDADFELTDALVLLSAVFERWDGATFREDDVAAVIAAAAAPGSFLTFLRVDVDDDNCEIYGLRFLGYREFERMDRVWCGALVSR